MSTQHSYKLSELILDLPATLHGNPDCEITGVAMIQDAKAGQITFLHNPLYKKFLTNTQASAVIIDQSLLADCPTNAIVTKNPHLTYAKIAHYFVPSQKPTPGIHASAVIGSNAAIDNSVHIGANCVIGDNVSIAANSIIKGGSVIADNAVIGKEVVIEHNVSIHHAVRIGDRCHIYSGVVVGSDGFGFANQSGAWHKVPQFGTVIIGNDVDIGANTTIDRGAIGDTIIEDGVKLDNLIQIAHNVHIGKHTIIAGCVGIAGSTTIGQYCMIGGATCLAGHIQIADRVMITGMTAVTKSITESGVFSSGIVGAIPNLEFRKQNARFARLEQLMQRVKTLEAAVKKMSEEK